MYFILGTKYLFRSYASGKEVPMGNGVVALLTMCEPNSQTGCPQVFLNKDASREQQVEIADDFGGKVKLSIDQYNIMIGNGKL